MRGLDDPARRALLAAAATLPLAACHRIDPAPYVGAWVGAAHERGHRLRELAPGPPQAASWPSAAGSSDSGRQRRAAVVVVGAGIAGLAAARALMRAGIDDVHVFDLEDAPGGNSRAHVMGGMACPLGAHYLPVPGEQAGEVAEYLAELGLSRTEYGRTVFDERTLCHTPQERLFIAGQWVDGLLPPVDALPAGERSETQRQYLLFHALVESAGRGGAFCVPTARALPSTQTAALDRITFAQWLDAQALTAPALRWYLDYCCRDDFGAGASLVSAWAGLHYFASRHGFHAPGLEAEDRDGVLTWPQGNAWLSARLAAGLGERWHPGCVALRLREGRHDASLALWNVQALSLETWTAGHVVLALPLFVAARLFEAAPGALLAAAGALQHAPWLVANLQLKESLLDHGGAAPAWDNVMMDSPTLGYVDAMHQSLRPHAGPTVLTVYWALGGNSAEELRRQRIRLLDSSWAEWSGSVVHELARPHPDITAKIERLDLMRYGHAMAVPTPGVRSHPALRALAQARGRVRFAHSDLSGYSVFEEAFFHGDRVGRDLALSLLARRR